MAQPQLSASVSVGAVFVEDGASINLNFRNLNVSGNFDGGLVLGPGNVVMNGVGASVRGSFPNLTLNAQVSANGAVTATGRVLVNGNLIVGGQTVQTGSLLIEGDGVLTMQDPQDVVRALSYAEFNGASTDGLLTAGVLALGGDFLQSNNDGAGATDSFAASGTHRVVFEGSAQSVFFYTPGSGAFTSHFQEVELADVGGSVSLSNATVSGQLRSATGVAPTLFGNNTLLELGGVDVDGLVIDNMGLSINGGPITAFDNVTFQNQSPTITQLAIAHPGAAAPFTFNDIVFQVAPTSGLYIDATDTVSDANVLTINLQCAQPSDGTASTATNGGAVVNWLGCGP